MPQSCECWGRDITLSNYSIFWLIHFTNWFIESLAFFIKFVFGSTSHWLKLSFRFNTQISIIVLISYRKVQFVFFKFSASS